MKYLAEMTFVEVQELGRDALAILPVGAIEAHGPHLPLLTDVVIARGMAAAGALELEARGFANVVIAPPLQFTSAGFAKSFAGTISLNPETVTAVLIDALISLGRSGFARIVLANAHLDPSHTLSLHEGVRVARETHGLAVTFPDITRKPWAQRLTEEFKSGACHAGQFETSIVMALRPDLVRESIRVTLEPNPSSLSTAIRAGKTTFEEAGGPSAYFGFPRNASVEEGRETLTSLGLIVAEAVIADRDGIKEDVGMKFTAKVALVTGGGRGIGADIAKSLAREGATVAISARTESEVRTVTDEVVAAGGRARFFVADLAQADQPRSLVTNVEAAFGPIDFLINNAGVASSAPVVKVSLDEWNRIFAINVTATFLCTQAVLPQMMKRRSGRVVNVASVAARFGAPYISAYAASKHAVLGFTRCVAAEVAAYGITANAVCPGFVDTEMVAASVARIVETAGLTSEQALDAIKNHSPQKRLLTTPEVTNVVLMLCSEESRGINGQAIVIDGGALLS